MYFAAGYRHQSEGERFSSLVSAFPQVKEVYFPWVREPSGRPILGYGEGDDTETIKTVLHDELVALKSLGVRLDLLLNANCYGELAMSRELELRVKGIIEELDSWGCKPETITAASPFIAHVVKKRFPEIETRASVNMRITTLQAMAYLAPWFDSFYIGRDVHRNLDNVKRFSDWAHSNGKTVGILANSGCLRNCPWQTYHDNLIAHSYEAMGTPRSVNFNPHLCWTMYESESKLPEILKATWIRPEDIDRYEPYVDFVKLATRQHQRMALVLDAYSSRSFHGNLLDLLEPGFAPAFYKYGVMLDNSRFPEDWAQTVARCDRGCNECGYCEKVYKQVATR